MVFTHLACPAPRHPTLRVLWLVLLGSQVIYLVLPFVLQPAGQPSDPSFVRTVSLALGSVSAVVGVGTIVYRRRALVAPIQAGHLDPNTTEGLAKVFRPFVLNLVLTESIAIYGLFLALLSQGPRPALPFAIAAFVLMYLHRPMAPDLSPPSPGVYRPPSL